ncbi:MULTISPECIES: hypothetical protein [unclassified Sutcliffiella]|uniref:hypothetical protein n=1 Tax=unclassified Sutcliffiella TaxID=2837532 RepID=UPI0030CCAB44
MIGGTFSKRLPSCLTIRDYKLLMIFIENSSNRDVILLVTNTIFKILEAESINDATKKYKESMEKTRLLSIDNSTKQDIYGLSHIAYVSKRKIYKN